uniref:Uncharacterized protein n=1 Tax=Globisporangium ultimum (strain ATCC 200006 / CBS 805.95 / DAOM BR144) TaxID=431595 RepID=K3WUJ7_GLOUD
MSASAFVAGVAVGGVRYGYVKFQLHERENVVQYSVDAVKQAFYGQPQRHSSRNDERYVALPSREHEYYTYIRESWNSKVFAFRDTVFDIFQVKK